MANPPITIGPFTNVPAPGSPIASAWPQQITTYVVNDLQPKSGFRIAVVSVPTNGNGDAVITLAPAFPTGIMGAVVSDASQGVDLGLIPKVMWTSTSRTTLIVRVFLHDGTKVINNASIVLSYFAIGY